MGDAAAERCGEASVAHHHNDRDAAHVDAEVVATETSALAAGHSCGETVAEASALTRD
jgi:hypothetical protein